MLTRAHPCSRGHSRLIAGPLPASQRKVFLLRHLVGLKPPEIAEVYFVSSIPFVTRPRDLSIIAAFSIIVSFLATIVPSMRAARLNPVEALRYE